MMIIHNISEKEEKTNLCFKIQRKWEFLLWLSGNESD